MRTIVLIACATAACMPPAAFPMPMTAAQAVADDSGPALVAYLSQADASADVCAVAPSGPHLHVLSIPERTAFFDALRGGQIKPALWKRCAKQLAEHLGADDRAYLFDAALDAYTALLHAGLDHDPALVERAQTLQRFYLDRNPGVDAHPAAVAALTSSLRKAIADKKLGRIATLLGQDVLDTIDIEHGSYHGSPVDTTLMEQLATDGNELTLRRFAERLPTAALRTEAQRRLVRIHIALSPFDEVRSGGAALEDRLLATGSNAVDLGAHPVVKAWFDPDRVPKRDIVVQQHVMQRTATLLGATTGSGAALSVVPELALHGTLMAQLTGISRPVTVCGASKDLDPSPCIAPSALSSDQPLVHLDGGNLRVADELAARDLLPLADQQTFSVPIRIANVAAASFSWGLHFARPADLVFSGAANGGRGPDLTVRVADPRPDRVTYDIDVNGLDYLAFVERADLAGYQAGSQGGAGFSGQGGASGWAGSSGGQCQNGGAGGAGDDGGKGGPGGVGGTVKVAMSCRSGSCGELEALVRGTIVSLGGPGGRGGSGGPGGSGGIGGSSRAATTHVAADGSIVVDDPGCSGGANGPNGWAGNDGSPGQPGLPGTVSF